MTILNNPNGVVTITNVGIGTAVATPGTTVRFTSYPTLFGGFLENRQSGANSFATDDPVILENACYFGTLSVRDCTVVPGAVVVGTFGYQGGYPFQPWWQQGPRVENLEVRGTMVVPSDNGLRPSRLLVTGSALIRGSLAIGDHGFLDFQPSTTAVNPQFRIENGATVSLGRYATMYSRGWTNIAGNLGAGSGARVRVEPPSGAGTSGLHVLAGGTLELSGGDYVAPFYDSLRQVDRPLGHHLAAVQGATANPWQFLVDGTLRARRFAMRDLGQNGLELRPGSSIGASPFDLREGVLGPAAGNGATILSVTTQNPVHATDVAFDNWSNSASYNVSAVPGCNVRIDQPGGNFSGPQHENDPGQTVQWGPQWSTMAAVQAHSIPGTGQIEMLTAREVDVARFEVYSPALPAAAVWLPVGGVSADASYSLPFSSTAAFEVVELSRRGVYRTIAGGVGRAPLAPAVGTCVLVDPSNPNAFASLAAAIAAVPTGGTVLVAPGVHQAGQISIARPLTIAARDAEGFTVNGSLAIAAGGGVDAVTIRGMTLMGSPQGSSLTVANTSRSVILDHVFLRNGTGLAWFSCTASQKVVLQAVEWEEDCVIVGSELFLSKCNLGGVTRLTNSRVEAVETVATRLLANSTWNNRGGIMPTLATHSFWNGSDTLPLHCRATPGHLVLACFALRGFTELHAVAPIDMPLLLDLGGLVTLTLGVADPTGFFGAGVAGPNLPALAGVNHPMQVFALDPAGTGRCGWTRDSMLLP